jgi:hypothetical protein
MEGTVQLSVVDPDSIEFLLIINFILLSAGCSFLRAGGYSCSFDVLYEGPKISK